MLDGSPRREVVERAGVAPADELGAALALLEVLLRVARDGDPLAVRTAAVLAVGEDGSCDVRR